MSIWVALLVALGLIICFGGLGGFCVYGVHAILNQDVKHRCPTCGQPTQCDYSRDRADQPASEETP